LVEPQTAWLRDRGDRARTCDLRFWGPRPLQLVAREGLLDARQIRMLLLAEMTAEFAAENALNRKIAVSRRWRVFRGDELEALEQAFGSYDPTEPLYAEVLAEIERRVGVLPPES
jgi:hypothetical protein